MSSMGFASVPVSFLGICVFPKLHCVHMYTIQGCVLCVLLSCSCFLVVVGGKEVIRVLSPCVSLLILFPALVLSGLLSELLIWNLTMPVKFPHLPFLSSLPLSTINLTYFMYLSCLCFWLHQSISSGTVGTLGDFLFLFIVVSPALNQCLAHSRLLINTCCINKYINNWLNMYFNKNILLLDISVL